MNSFVINVDNFPQQAAKLKEVLSNFDRKLKREQKTIKNYNLQTEISQVNNFLSNLSSLVENMIKKEDDTYSRDIFGNEYQKEYKYIHITYFQNYRFAAIRFLGYKNGVKNRYYLSDVAHPFSPLTINLIKKIKKLTSPLVNSISTGVFQNTPGLKNLTWETISVDLFEPVATTIVTEDLNDLSYERLVDDLKKPYLTAEEITKRNSRVIEEKIKIFEKSVKDFDTRESIQKIVKQTVDLVRDKSGQHIINTIGTLTDRYNFSSIIKEALLCLAPGGCEDILRTMPPNRIINLVSVVFSADSDAFLEILSELEKSMFGEYPDFRERIELYNKLEADQIELQKCYQEKIEEGKTLEELAVLRTAVNNNYERLQRAKEEYETARDEIFDNLRLSERQRELFSKDNFDIFDIVSDTETDQEKAIMERNREILLASLRKYISLNDFCLLFMEGLKLDLSQVKFPELRPINDIFMGLSAQLLDIIFSTLSEIALLVIEAFISEVLNCDNLKELIGDVIKGSNTNYSNLINFDQVADAKLPVIGSLAQAAVDDAGNAFMNAVENSGVYYDLIKLFGDSSKKALEEISANFINDNNIVEDYYDPSDTASVAQLKQLIFDFSLISEFSYYFSAWEIDSSGEKLVLMDGTRIVDVADVDESLGKNLDEALAYLPVCSISDEALLSKIGEVMKERIDEISKNREEQVQNQLAAATSPELNDDEIDEEKLREELTDSMYMFTSLSVPTDVVRAFAGEMSDDSANFALQIIRTVGTQYLSKIITNTSKTKKLFYSIGTNSGLDDLLAQLELLLNRPENKNRSIINKLCSPFEDSDALREALMLNVVGADVAVEIIDNINREKVDKYNEILNTLLDISGGRVPTGVAADPTRKLLDEVNEKILKPALGQPTSLPEPRPAKESPPAVNFEEAIRDKMKEVGESSPIYLGMLEVVLQSLFYPIRTAFDNAMLGYVDSMSQIKEVEEIIPRKKKYFYKNEQGAIREHETINPKFKQFLNDNLVPFVPGDNPSSDSFATLFHRSQMKPVPLFNAPFDYFEKDEKFDGIQFMQDHGDDVDKVILADNKEYIQSGNIKTDYTTLDWDYFRAQERLRELLGEKNDLEKFLDSVEDDPLIRIGMFFVTRGASEQYYLYDNIKEEAMRDDFVGWGYEGHVGPKNNHPRDPLKFPVKTKDKQKVLGETFINGIQQGFSPSMLKVEIKEDIFKISVKEFVHQGSTAVQLDQLFKKIGEGGLLPFLQANTSRAKTPSPSTPPLAGDLTKFRG